MPHLRTAEAYLREQRARRRRACVFRRRRIRMFGTVLGGMMVLWVLATLGLLWRVGRLG